MDTTELTLVSDERLPPVIFSFTLITTRDHTDCYGTSIKQPHNFQIMRHSFFSHTEIHICNMTIEPVGLQLLTSLNSHF